MAVWREHARDDPKPSREDHVGRFEVKARDGRARVGALSTAHGVVTTPTLLPVINPNLRTIEPREMWDTYGIEMLITNSYIIWKHEKLRQHALDYGVHDLLDYPGAIMTDSGTFQAYVYGDVEVGVEEIVTFQRDIGVDVATMLDVFTRPDMTRDEVHEAVQETTQRAKASLAAAGSTMLNGPIQGGLHADLRRMSARGMGAHGFSVHPIGGIVPVMEQQRYADLARIMLASMPELPPERPVHMFGCGHPMLFPMLIALGADLFDSAAYALFARDDRMLTPTGTVHLEDLREWPVLMPCVASLTPEDVRRMDDDERMVLLSRFNLEVTLAELAACRQAVHDGRIWERAERRSHAHPALREAFLWLTTSPARGTAPIPAAEHLLMNDRAAASDTSPARGQWESAWDWVVEAQNTPGQGALRWAGEDTFVRPAVVASRRRLHRAWSPVSDDGAVVILHGAPGPWRDRVGPHVMRARAANPALEVLVLSPIGLVPWSFEDLQPFAHVEGPEWLWRRPVDHAWVRRELARLNLEHRPFVTVDLRADSVGDAFDAALRDAGLEARVAPDAHGLTEVELDLLRAQTVDKSMLELNLERSVATAFVGQATFVMSSTGRVRNVKDSQGRHILSPRLGNGGLSLTDEGAKILHALNLGHEAAPATVTVVEDAVPFVGAGRNVMHGFILAASEHLRPGVSCLVLDPEGVLVAHGVAQCTAEEAMAMQKGIAVRVRGGLQPSS
ncbi:MAG: tRNA guanosine(15) transglycosylase TgtA [Candidatus Thermoplasmatota archaeon]|nr:tRNA guanosine(15) transglycosylase TgtA [Candidatus Thermoplasmatota archaeon]MEC8266506.1 tRNA guanosine(15) transglycosylase TgtA [Candidatus Thermoplasmatota archaeon]